MAASLRSTVHRVHTHVLLRLRSASVMGSANSAYADVILDLGNIDACENIGMRARAHIYDVRLVIGRGLIIGAVL